MIKWGVGCGATQLTQSANQQFSSSNINRMKECIIHKVDEDCGEEAVVLIEHMMDRVASAAMGVICRKADPFEGECVQLLPPIGQKAHSKSKIAR